MRQRDWEEGSWRRATRVASRHREAEATSWHEREFRLVKEDRSRWVGIPSCFVEISLEIHASVSLQMHKGNAMLHNSPSALELTQAYCSFVLFLLLPWLYFLYLWRNVWCPYQNHQLITDRKEKCFRRRWRIRRAEGVLSHRGFGTMMPY